VRQLAHFEVSSLKELYHEIPDVIWWELISCDSL
jgi:hypothetical protein